MSNRDKEVPSASNNDYKNWMEDVEDVAKIGRWELDLNDQSIKWTAGVFEIFEIKNESIPPLEKLFEYYLEEYREGIEQEFSRLTKSGEDLEHEARILSKQGKEKWIRVLGKKQGQIVFGTVQEISDYKQIELQQNLILDNTEEFFVVVDKNYKIITFNQQFANEYETLFRRKVERGNSILEYSAGSADELKKVYQSVFSGSKEKRNLVVPGDEKDRFYSMVYKPAYNGLSDSVVGAFVTIRDVTEQKEAEIELEQLYERLSKHLENSPLGVVEYDNDLAITKWSKKCEEIFGWSEEEIIQSGKTAFDLIYDEDVETVEVVAGELVSGIDEGNVSINRNYTKGEKIIDCIWYNSVIKKKDGSVDTIMSLVQDITQRVKSEKKLQDSNKEKSILLAEIHHRVKNNLAIISGLLQLQIFKVKDENLINVLLSSISRIKSIALIHEQLYTSQDFRNISFDKNIEKLVKSISEIMNPSQGIEIEYNLDEVYLNINQAIPCALFMNEAVTNVFKHAFENSIKGKLTIECVVSDDQITIAIKDNGRGFNTQKLKAENGSLGVKLLQMVSEQLHGESDIESNGKNGTEVKLSFKKSEEVSGSSARVFNY